MLSAAIALVSAAVGVTSLNWFSKKITSENQIAFTIVNGQIDKIYRTNEKIYPLFNKIYFVNLRQSVDFTGAIKLKNNQRLETRSHFEYTIPEHVIYKWLNDRLPDNPDINNESLEAPFGCNIAKILINENNKHKSIDDLRRTIDEKLKTLCETEYIIIERYNIEIIDKVFQSWGAINVNKIGLTEID